ncbi:APC family permease [Luteimonas vadosa]|uniref:Arginine/agmatine antiporter n=1 Tax=Luteimonas vadosa TaxID=1165507 RepID=A0ABP9DY02_9GAMM
MTDSEPAAATPTLRRAVSRWQIVGLSINDVVGSGIYLLPAAVAALLGGGGVWAILLAGAAVGLLVLCYAQAASYFDQPGGSYLYAREAFGPFVGFEIGWMTWLTRVTVAASLSKGLAQAVAYLWPPAAEGWGNHLVVVGSLALLTWINLIGVRAAARTAVVLVVAKLLPLLFFVVVGVFFVDWSRGLAVEAPPMDNLGEGALLLLFAYAGFENTPAAAGEYRNPRRDVPFALVTMIVLVSLTYAAVQVVAQGTLPGLAQSASPLAEAAGAFAGPAAALLLTVGAVVSILGTNSNTMLFGPRYLYALSVDGFGPQLFARVHPRWRTPAAAVLVQGGIAVALALSGSFVQLALLSVVARLFSYMGTASAVLVFARRHRDQATAFRLPGGPLIPLLALAMSLGLLASATWQNLVAAAIALLVGAVLYRFRRPPQAPSTLPADALPPTA